MPSYQTLKRVAEERKKQAELLRVKSKKNSILLVLMSVAVFVGLALVLYVWFQFGGPLRAAGESLVFPKTALYAIILYAVFLLAFAALLIYHKQNSNQIMTGVDELASIDSLTGCHKFLKFQVHAEELLASLREKPWFFLYFDIKNFKYINDAYGYSVGDETLIHIADSMRKVTETKDLISRVNGDSFVLLKPYSSDAELDAFFQTLTAEIEKAPVCLRHKYRMYLSAGVYVVSSNEEALSVAAMVDRAIIARDTVKHLSGTRYAMYTEKLREQIHYEKELEQEMVSALANGEFEIYFQPKCDIQKGDTIVGAETLVRWNSSKKGMLSPSSFIPLMEKNGFIVEVDLFVFELVCSYLRERLNRRLPVVPISVNVSGIDMFQSNFVSLYTEVKQKYDIPDGLLQLEFTESIAYDDHERFSNIIKELNANGFVCSLDDFGKGNSSLNVIKDLPVSVLKLDMMFFRKSEFRERAEAVITSIVSMAKALGMKTVAEGVESRDQVEFLRKIGCDVVQGYVFAKPMPAHKMNEYIDVLPKQEALRSTDVDLSVSHQSLWGDAPCKAEYQAVLNFVDAVVTEIDLDHGTFHVVSNPDSKGSPASKRESYDESMRRTAQQRIHPEDREEWLNRFSTNGLRTAFFRGEDKISFKYRALDESDKEYNWFEMTVLRLVSGDQKSSRALSFLQNVHFRKWLDGNGGISQVRLAEAVLALYRSVYELDLVTLRVKRLEVIRQEEGFSAGYRELIDHVANLLHDEDRAAYLQQLAPGALRTAFQGGMGAVYMEYRMRVKNEYRWFSVTVVPANNVPQGRSRAMFFVKDIHDRKAKDLERYHNVNRLKEAIISTFEEMAMVNLSLDELEEISKDNQIPSGVVKTYSQYIMRFAESRIHPDDRERILSTFSREALIQSMITEGIPELIERCRVKDAEGNYHWMRFYAIAEPKSTPESFQIYLYSKNIDRIMREMEILQKKADRDSLTGLYNRGIFEKMVKDCLKKTAKGKLHAFLMIDVDDFKKINDQWGHMAGDETLMSLSEKIQSSFRTEDLVGRIGGDEFVVFMKDIPSAESARKKASELCRLFCGPLRSETYEGIVTCSIGGALYGADGTTYEDLFRNADDALYKAKAKGKNCANFHS